MLVNIPFVSQSVLDTLGNSESLTVHSIFDNGINIKGDDRLIFLGKQDGPSALNIEQRLIPVITQLKVGDTLQYENQHLVLNTIGLTLDFNTSQSKSYDLSPKDILPFTKDKVVRMILGYDFQTGFDISTQELLDTLNQKLDANPVAYCKHLFGRGKGLTPSGDDFLLGMIAYNHVKPYLNEEFFQCMDEKMRLKQTTDISLNYLKDACDGLFTEDIIKLFEAMQRGDNVVARIYNIASFGHSSGKDTLSGIVCGIIMEQKIRRI